MSNQQARPLIAPSEYERNKAAISNYRQYLDIYEKLNEQGLKNHEEVARMEMLLQQRIQAGEEAKKQLELLKQTAGRLRLTDGAVVVPDITAMAPPTPPVTLTTPQASSSSAYIEEVHQGQMPPSTSSYRPYSTTRPMNPSNIPTPSYVPSTSENIPQHNQQMHRNPPTSYPQARPVVQAPSNPVQQSQIPEHLRYYRPHIQQQAQYSQSMQNSTPAQSEYSHNLSGNSDRARRTSSSRPNAVPVLQHQSSTRQQNPPHRGTTLHQQAPENQSLVHGQINARQATTSVSAPRNLEASFNSRPQAPSGPSGPTPTGMSNPVRVLSSLDGALGEITARKTQSPDVPAVQSSDSKVAQSTADANRNSMNAIQSPPPPPPTSNIVPQPSSSFANMQLPLSPSVSATKQAPSPVRTPKQADKAHLARDLLRALKRPRPEVSSSSAMEPEPKRHAPDLANKPAILLAPKSPLNVQVVQPSISTPVAAASTPKISPSSQMVQSSVPASSAPPLAPPTVATPPVAASTSMQTVTPAVPFQATTPYASSTSSVPASSSDAVSRLGSSTLSLMVRSQINRGTSFGHQPSGSFQYVDMAGVGQSQPSQVNVPAKPIPIPEGCIAFPEEERSNVITAETSNTSVQAATPVRSPVKAENDKPRSPVKAENDKPSAAINLQGPPAATTSTVNPLPEKVPLFFPSPTSSPALASATPSVDRSLASSSSAAGKENKDKTARNPTYVKYGSKLLFAHVEVPPLPDWAKKWKARQNQLSEVDDLDMIENLKDVSKSRSPSLGDFTGPPPSSTPSPAVKDVNFADGEESNTEEEDLQFGNYDEAEQEVLHEQCSILRESFCRWDKCEAVLNTPGNLLRHINMVHRPRRINAESPWICQWAGCGYTVIARDDYKQHIEKHAVFPLWCPFKDCTENFRTPRQCIRHKRSDHDSKAVLRQTATLSTVSSQTMASMPNIPKTLPAYMTEFVRPASIPKYRHETLMVSVLRRISGNVPAHLQRYNAARPMPMTPSGKDAEPQKNTPYSFLEHRSTRYSSYLSSPARSKNFQPLCSSYVTNLAKRGLVLWPDKDDREALPEAMMEELERIPMEEDAVEDELLNEEGHDVFGPMITIKSPSKGGETRGGDNGGIQ